MQHKNIDKILNSALDTLLSSSGTTMIDTLSKNRRQLERKFSKNIGLSPKQLSKIVRLQAVLKSLLSNSDVNFAQIAQEHDYYDQAHFIKDFNEFTGVTPREFYGDDLKMSLIFESRK